MHSLKQQLMLLVIGPLLLLSICVSVVTGFFMRDRAVLATNTKATADLATGEAIIELMYPGAWVVKDGILYKGPVKISNNFEAVDKIAALTGDTVTIFLEDERVSTTVREKTGERAIGTKASDIVIKRVLKHGQQYLGQANVVGELYQTAYKPIRDSNGKIVGMFYVGISKKFSENLINNSILTIVIFTIVLTVGVTLIAWFFTQRAIIGPLKQITMGTKQVASGHVFNKLEVKANNEIGELAAAFNQMIDGMQGFAMHMAKVAGSKDNYEGSVGQNDLLSKTTMVSKENREGQQENIDERKEEKIEELPKGLNEVTLRQILSYLNSIDTPKSAEEIGEGVNLTRVTARRYLEYLEKTGRVTMELKYGTVGRPVKMYKAKD